MGLLSRIDAEKYKMSLLHKATSFSVAGSFYDAQLFFKKLGTKYPFAKMVVLVKQEKKYTPQFFANIPTEKIDSFSSSTDFWDGLCNYGSTQSIKGDDIYPYLQLVPGSIRYTLTQLEVDRFQNDKIFIILLENPAISMLSKIPLIKNDMFFLTKTFTPFITQDGQCQ